MRDRIKAGKWIAILVAVLGLVGSTTGEADEVIWTDHYTNDAVLTGATQLGLLNNGLTIGVGAFSDNDSGILDLSFGIAPGFHSISHGTLGGQNGYLKMSFLNLLNDPQDYLEATITFDIAVRNLQFSLLDIDVERSLLGVLQNEDAVEVYMNGSSNVLTDASIYTMHSNVRLDNHSYLDGFETNGLETNSNSMDGNLDIDFSGYEVSSVTIRFRGTDDAIVLPTQQTIGVSNFVFSTVPEPSSLIILFGVGIATACMRRRRIRLNRKSGFLVLA